MENEKPFPYGLRLNSIERQKEPIEEKETNSLRIQTCFQSLAKWNIKENKKPIAYGLRLDSIQWQKEHKDESEIISLRIKACFQSKSIVT